ncbi:MAG TPA: hypothetical protein ENK96_04500 [Desulfobulbaceae bacterium]|nr:hypothetical protein [Desulfobulbaceae bacterium]
MTSKKAAVELDKMNVSQKKDLLGSLLNSLVADIEPHDRQKLLHDIFLTDEESKPVIEMVEY